MGMLGTYTYARCPRCWRSVLYDGPLPCDHDDCVAIWKIHKLFLLLVQKIYNKLMPKEGK